MPAATPKKRKPKQDTRQSKPETDSVFTPDLGTLIAGKPDHETAPPALNNFFERCLGFVQRGTHECFVVARTAGEILSYHRKRCPHGNSSPAAEGELPWPSWCEKYCPSLHVRTASKWADLFDHIPRNDPEYDTLQLSEGYVKVAFRKGELNRDAKRKNKGKQPKPKGDKTPTLGSAVSQVIRAADRLKTSEAEYKPVQSRSRTADLNESHIEQCLKATEIILDVVGRLAKKNSKIHGDKKSLNGKIRQILEGIRKNFAPKHEALNRLSPNPEEAA